MIEAGSFRDPAARVFYDNDRVLRGLTADAAAADAAVRANGLMDQLVGNGLFVANWRVDDETTPEGVPSAAVIESKVVPLITYPQEWSFTMMKDAALLTLDANLAALDHGFILKDASAFNVTFDGPQPRILDVTSLEAFGEEGVWVAYAQFCDHFLAPLMLEAYAGVPFQRTLAGNTEGISIGDLSGVLRGRSGMKKGVASHVKLRSALDRKAATMDTDARSNVGRTRLPIAVIRANIAKMRKLVAGLETTAASTWADYESDLPYGEQGKSAKGDFVRKAAASALDHRMAVDVGANAGLYTKMLGEAFDHVAGIDSDPGAVDGLYAVLKRDGQDRITPAVIDITNPTPAFGWRGRERKAIWDRLRPSFATWLAVYHHLCLGAGIPLAEVVGLTYEVSPEAVVEFVHPEDKMARHISATRQAELAPYTRDHFEQYATAAGSIVSREDLSPTRTIYHLRRG